MLCHIQDAVVDFVATCLICCITFMHSLHFNCCHSLFTLLIMLLEYL